MPTRHLTDTSRAEAVSSEETRNLTAALKERDATIARLERTLTEQQSHIEMQRDALERAKFKTKILEQSYSTQLGEARERAAAAERLAADLQTWTAELQAGHETLTKELAEARASLDSIRPDAVSIDEMLSSFAVSRDRPLAHDPADQADAPPDLQAVEEMLAPEVMFAGKGK